MAKNRAHPPAIDGLRIDERQSIIDKIVDAIQNNPNEVILSHQGAISKEDLQRLWQSFESKIQPTKLTDEASSASAIGHAVWNHFYKQTHADAHFSDSQVQQTIPRIKVATGRQGFISKQKRTHPEMAEASGKTVKRALRKKARTDRAAATPAQDKDVDDEAISIIQNIREEIHRNPEAVKQIATRRHWRFIRRPFFAEEPPRFSTNTKPTTNSSSFEKLEKPVSHREDIARHHYPQTSPEQHQRQNLAPKESSTAKQTHVGDNAQDISGPSWPVRYTLWKERTENPEQSQPLDMEAQTGIDSCHHQSATQSIPALRPQADHPFTYNPPQIHHTEPAKPPKPSMNTNSPPSGIRVGKSIGNIKGFAPTNSKTTPKTKSHTTPRPNKPTIPPTMDHSTSSTKTQTNSQPKAKPNSTMHHPLPRKPSLDLSRDVEMPPPSSEKPTHPPVPQPRPSPPTETAAQRALREEHARAEKLFWIDLEASLGVNQ
ncbi:hypothetical protein HYALB_00010345 [Hymenoscyphus albidus]|uniref:Uncharacterized protein n=1 Tax=Hymenoscyphus albidus TaxID=595503 RepID=A0A9N9LJY3_9HELO|nr:hypothetical protein HYALB_00010345 [Hymenoscyphus albidus]